MIRRYSWKKVPTGNMWECSVCLKRFRKKKMGIHHVCRGGVQ